MHNHRDTSYRLEERSGSNLHGPRLARRQVVGRMLVAPALMTVCSGSAFAAASHLRCLINANDPVIPQPPVPAGTTTLDSFLRVRLYAVTTATRNAFAVPPPSDGPAALGHSSTEPQPPAASASQPHTGSALPVDGVRPVDPPTVVGGGTDAPGKSGAASAGASGATPSSVTRYYVRGEDLVDYKDGIGLGGQWQQIDINDGYRPVSGPVAPIDGAVPSEHYVVIRFDGQGFVRGFGPATASGDNGAPIGTSCWVSAGPLIRRGV